jgi:hypothetical protein
MDKVRFKFGVILNGLHLKKWQFNVIDRLQKTGCQLQLLIIDSGESKQTSKFAKYTGKHALYNLFLKTIDGKGQLQNISINESTYKQCNILYVKPLLKGKYSQYFSNEDIQRVKSYELDFIFRFGMNIIRGDILEAPKYGIWSFHHDDEEVIRGGPPGFWEIFYRHDYNGLVLQRLSHKLDSGEIIRKAKFPIISHSYRTHLYELLRYSADIAEFAVQSLHKSKSFHWTKTDSQAKIYKKPSNVKMILFLFRLGFNRLAFNFHDLFLQEKWNMAVYPFSFDKLMEMRHLPNPIFYPNVRRNSFVADVFALNQGNKLQLFFEDYSYKNDKGVISTVSFDIGNRMYGEHKVILETDYHLAFPFIHQQNNSLYLLPETSITGKQYMFSLNEKLEPGEKEILMAADCVDAVTFQYEGLQWLFCGHKSLGPNHYLFAYYRQNEQAEWVSHEQNPIVADASNARMAGGIFRHKDKLYRFAQKNNLYYGEMVHINEILSLDSSKFSEKRVLTVDASWFKHYSEGIHTLSFVNDWLILDAKRHVFIPYVFWKKLKGKLRI